MFKYIIILLLITGCGGGSNHPQPAEEPIEEPVEEILESTVLLEITHKFGGRFQDFAIHEDTIYTLGDDGIIDRFDTGQVLQDSKGSSLPSKVAGHQGLSYYKGLWSTDYYDNKSMVWFDYRDSKPLFVKGRYKLFGDEFKTSSSCTPFVNKDYVAAYSRLSGQIIVRVWYNDFKASGDYSNKYLYEWKGPDFDSYVQGMAIIKDSVFIVMGGRNYYKPKYLYEYTLDGDLLSKELLTLGKPEQLPDNEKYEPEGLGVINDRLVIGISTDVDRLIDLDYRSSQSLLPE